MRTETRPSLERQLLWATIAALVFANAAAAFVVPFFSLGDGQMPAPLSSSDGSLAVASVLAAAIVGWVCWLGVEQFLGEHPIVGGAHAGLVTGIVAHPLAWFLWPLLPPSQELWIFAFLMPIYSIFSLLFVGWITVPLAVAAGVVVGAVRIGVLRLA